MSRFCPWLIGAMFLAIPPLAVAQVSSQPTPPPIVTADNEPWYGAGDAITWAGDYYYPAGALVFFNGNQMVRTGSYRGVPLYSDATREPYGIVYVPVSGRLMQPYERRRDGEIAGTTGSQSPSFPVRSPAEDRARAGTSVGQAAAPPAYAPPYDSSLAPATGDESRRVPAVAATSGQTWTPAPGPLISAQRPEGLNGVWVTYEGRRWFMAGTAVDQTSAFTKRGEYFGFPVYVKAGDTDTIYLPNGAGLVVPYSAKRRN